jgi:hypothetical protein
MPSKKVPHYFQQTFLAWFTSLPGAMRNLSLKSLRACTSENCAEEQFPPFANAQAS